MDREAELLENRVALGEEFAGSVEASGHRIEPAQRRQDLALGTQVAAQEPSDLLTAPDARRRGCRAEEHGRRDPAQDGGEAPLVPRPPSMGGSSLPRLFRRGGATFEPVHLALKISEAGKPELVSCLLETPSRTHAGLSGLHHGFPRLDLE